MGQAHSVPTPSSEPDATASDPTFRERVERVRAELNLADASLPQIIAEASSRMGLATPNSSVVSLPQQLQYLERAIYGRSGLPSERTAMPAVTPPRKLSVMDPASALTARSSQASGAQVAGSPDDPQGVVSIEKEIENISNELKEAVSLVLERNLRNSRAMILAKQPSKDGGTGSSGSNDAPSSDKSRFPQVIISYQSRNKDKLKDVRELVKSWGFHPWDGTEITSSVSP